MDPHSRRSQFNQRTPKTGPYSPTVRFMEPPPKILLDKFTKSSSSKSPSADASDTSPLFTQRPIATNSRVKQDEQYKKDMFLAFVNKALLEKLDGPSKDFDDLVDQFNPKKTGGTAVPTTQLRLWIIALSHVLSRLERRHSHLVEAIINLPWTTMDTAFVKSYTVFIGMLLSARPEYLSLVLSKIALGLTHQSGLQALNTGGPESSATPLTRRIIYDRLHYLLRHLLSLIPTLPSTLQPLLVRNFPHKRQSQVAQVTYIRNLLRVTEYCSELADRILATIIDRAIQIDVEIQVELEELEEEDAPDHDDVFEFDPFDTVVGQEGDDSDSDGNDSDGNLSDLSSDDGDTEDDSGKPQEQSDTQHIHDMVDKLDAILKLIFDHFNHVHAAVETNLILPLSPSTPRPPTIPSPIDSPRASSPLSEESGRALRAAQFHSLLSIFDRTIIRTFKSRYTQFLIFWYSSLDPEFSDLFQGLLVEKALLGNDVPAVTRTAAASYIASFVSRAQFVDREGARRVTNVLCAFLRTHLDAYDSIMQSAQALPSMAHHSVFYAIAQAVFLIFCFRWRDLQEEEDDAEDLRGRKKWMPELNVVQRAITSSLNPLKVCSSNVVMQFARVAQATDFIYCYSILEANKRSEYNGSNGTGQKVTWGVMGEKINTELHTFFPFDPYKLPRSSSYIQGVYREWASVAIDDEEDEDDDAEREGSVENDDNAIERAQGVVLADTGGLTIPGTTSQGADADANGLGESFGGMSISPAQPRVVVVAVS
ncbi:RNA polymerase I-specific transcription initiation factor RRN3 [Leucogyrophana mollusca]|uniref:RNA polymerase I-specific transcription initiation factor RRN3 n=1 Tax=Leucogyrophana mollusca TaxID=85980 RepID=A0ACB8BCU2_9AGAM|nr:RNA polymerase I-specific transcription initiation factor RRN3 [Leucogyrophana mollusca]